MKLQKCQEKTRNSRTSYSLSLKKVHNVSIKHTICITSGGKIMKKKLVSLLLVSAMVASLAAGCGSKQASDSDDGEAGLSVTTTFAGEDGNAGNYKEAVKAFQKETGIKINDSSAVSDETFKTRVETDFQAGSESDVLFFFNGADANSFIEEGKVVSIEEIRKEYPEYASNMNDDLIAPSLVDGEKYAVPVNGYWEGLFCNTEVLEAAGVEVPGADYTWDQFMADCQKIKDAGYTPIAAALGEIPHYWWEHTIFNHTTLDTHCEVPESVDKGNGPAWVEGMEDVKELYEQNFFPENTLSAKDDETFALFTSGKAAFVIDGSWKVGGIAAACQSDPEDPETLDTEKLDKFTVTYVPTKGERKATDLIGGLSMGYYITQKAWEDETKREDAVKFVEYMTSNDMVAKFAQHTASALKEAPEVDESQFNSLQLKSIQMMSGVTSLTGAVQDLFNGECRTSTFDGMPMIVTGEVNAKDAVAEGLAVYAEQNEE